METTYGLSQAEFKLAEIIWTNQPIPASALVKMAEESFGWKRTTTYTLLKRMIDKGVMKNENAVVSAIVSREEFFAKQSHNFVDDTFGGSLPLLIASFMRGKKLTQAQAEEIRQLIDTGEWDEGGE